MPTAPVERWRPAEREEVRSEHLLFRSARVGRLLAEFTRDVGIRRRSDWRKCRLHRWSGGALRSGRKSDLSTCCSARPASDASWLSSLATLGSAGGAIGANADCTGGALAPCGAGGSQI